MESKGLVCGSSHEFEERRTLSPTVEPRALQNHGWCLPFAVLLQGDPSGQECIFKNLGEAARGRGGESPPQAVSNSSGIEGKQSGHSETARSCAFHPLPTPTRLWCLCPRHVAEEREGSASAFSNELEERRVQDLISLPPPVLVPLPQPHTCPSTSQDNLRSPSSLFVISGF